MAITGGVIYFSNERKSLIFIPTHLQFLRTAVPSSGPALLGRNQRREEEK